MENDCAGLKLSSFASLDQASELERVCCVGCSRSRRYYCGECCRALLPTDSAPAPSVELPFRVDILQSGTEQPSKSTAAHAVILAPAYVRIWRPAPACIADFLSSLREDFGDTDGEPSGEGDLVFVLHPGETALTPTEVALRNGESMKRLVVIDSSWTKSSGIVQALEREVKGKVVHVGLDPEAAAAADPKFASHRSSGFWRFPPVRGERSFFNPTMASQLKSTIEAIHSFAVQWSLAVNPHEKYDGRFDDLLWLFSYQRSLVQHVYETHPGKRARLMRKSKNLLSDF
mmetsp:Transcript_8900/g.17939  ORF Transcript_8900/g.17939 Transcript_8900/m.17939 type:complete len:288 (-) Transcript_8900:880-1743(-)